MFSLRVTRIVAMSLAGGLLLIAAWEFLFLWGYIGAQNAIGTDHTYYVEIADRWLRTGEFYLPRQLEGPYVVQADYDVLYPPIALVLFVPFVWLPYPLWWIVPGAVGAVALWRLRPAMWTWPIIAFLVAWPRGISNVIYGNSDMWVFTAIAAGVLLAWPAVLVVIKPSVAFFALLGIRHRSWWVAAGALVLISIPIRELWQEFFVAIGNSDVKWWYSLEDMPPLFIPVVAWLGRRDAPHAWRIQVRRPWFVRQEGSRGQPAS